MCDPVPVAEMAEPHIDIRSMTEEPVEIEESFTANPARPKISPVVLEAPLESPSGPDQELPVDSTEGPEVETDPMLCPADVSNRPQSTSTESDGPNAESEDEPTDECVNPPPSPPPKSPEIPTGSRSLVPLPRRWTRSRKQPERYTPIRRLQVLPVTQAQDGSSIWLFPNVGIAVTLSRSLPNPL